MIKINKQSFVVFDLDDTLYKEKSYNVSGLNAVSAFVKKIYENDLGNLLVEWQQAGIKDIWQNLCHHLQLNTSVKESFLWIYRLHQPNISLSKETKEILHLIQQSTAGIAILTDGRSTTQRLKIAALGLDQLPAFISEDWQSEKPDPKRFIEISHRYKADNYVYIGDNPKKDFKAPNELGWHTIGLIGDSENIHSQSVENLEQIFLPNIWVESLDNLREFLC